jgi:hypothetical protein
MNPPLSRSPHVEQIERLEARVAELEQDLFAARDAVLTEGQMRLALEVRVAELEEEDRVKTKADEACALAAEAEIERLQARVAALTAALQSIAANTCGARREARPRLGGGP